MSIFRLQNNTPEVYVNNSRDFQLLCRAFDCINAGVRSEINSMATVVDTNTCINRVIQLLQTKLGFFTTNQYNDDDIRTILQGFVQMVRNKGSKKGIEYAVYAYLRTKKIIASAEVSIDNDSHIVRIGMNTAPIETKLLEEILSYIIPTGYFVSFEFYNKQVVDNKYTVTNGANFLQIGNLLNAQLAVENRTMNAWTQPASTKSTPDGYERLSQSVGVVEIPKSDDDSSIVIAGDYSTFVPNIPQQEEQNNE